MPAPDTRPMSGRIPGDGAGSTSLLERLIIGVGMDETDIGLILTLARDVRTSFMVLVSFIFGRKQS